LPYAVSSKIDSSLRRIDEKLPPNVWCVSHVAPGMCESFLNKATACLSP